MNHLNINKKQLIHNIMICLEPTEVPQPYVAFMRDGLGIMFGHDDGEAYLAALDILLDFDDLTNKYSPKTITAGFQSLLVKFFSRESDILSEGEVKRELDIWLTEMITAEEYEFSYLVVVENLKIHQQELIIGKVKLAPLSEENIHRLIKRIHAQIDANKYYVDKKEERETAKQNVEKDIRAQFNPDERSALMSIKLPVRDIAKEFSTANKHFQDVLHLLRFLGTFVYRKSHRAHIDLKGELARGFTTYLALSDDGGWKFSQSVSGYLFKFEITSEYLQVFRNVGLDTFSEILSKNSGERTEVEKRLINSIVWASKAISDSEYDQFIQFCIAIENLLGGDKREGITRILAERLALVLEDECDKRMEIFNNAMKIFSIRGQLVHEGSPQKEVEFLEYLPYVTGYTRQAVIATTRLINEHSWTKFKEIANYLQRLKFS